MNGVTLIPLYCISARGQPMKATGKSHDPDRKWKSKNEWGNPEKLPKRNCAHCGNLIKPRLHVDKNGRSKGWYQPTKFCSMQCSGLAQVPTLKAKAKGSTDKHGYPLLSRLNSNQNGKSKGYQQPRHIAEMEAFLGRQLHPWETVHHKNGNRKDYRIGNLELRTGRHGKGARVIDLLDALPDTNWSYIHGSEL